MYESDQTVVADTTILMTAGAKTINFVETEIQTTDDCISCSGAVKTLTWKDSPTIDGDELPYSTGFGSRITFD